MKGASPTMSVSAPCDLARRSPASRPTAAAPDVRSKVLRDNRFMTPLYPFGCRGGRFEPGRFCAAGQAGLHYDFFRPGARTREQALGVGERRQLVRADDLAAIDEHRMRIRSAGGIDEARDRIGCRGGMGRVEIENG